METNQPRGWLENRTLGWALLSSVAVWLSFPPSGAWILAWIAPYGWLRVIAMPKLDGKRPRLTVFLAAGYIYWLLMTWWVTLPHWAAGIGLLFLAAYLALYMFGFIMVSRWLVHRAGWSTVVAAPVVWVAMEMARSYLFTGFALAPLSHTQVDFLPVLQLARYTGAYGVSFLVMLFAAAFERAIRHRVDASRRLVWPVVAALGCVAAVFLLPRQLPEDTPGSAANVALIQGSLDTSFPGDRDEMDRAFKQYTRMTREVTAGGNIDLVVWPESMFRFDIFTYDSSLTQTRPQDASYTFSEWADLTYVATRKAIQDFNTHCLMGTSTLHFEDVDGSGDRYNTAAYFAPNGDLVDSYHKMHPVMFGEYVPLGNVFPEIYNLMPIGEGLTPGKKPIAVAGGELSFAPNICFENLVPHLIRRHVRELADEDKDVDCIVTLTNDGWFWGSPCLDLHLACGVLRAVENGRPVLIAANTGISAEIDRFGRVLQKGPKRASKVLVAQPFAPDTQELTAYTRFGDWFAFSCAAVCAVGIALGYRSQADS